MSEIRVETGDLREGSQNLTGSGNDLASVGKQLSGIAGSIGNAYGGQLQRAIGGIVGEGIQTGIHLQNRSFELAEELISRLYKFEAANVAGYQAMLASSLKFGNFITSSSVDSSSFLTNSELIRASILLGMAGLGGLGSIYSFISILPSFYRIFGNMDGSRVQEVLTIPPQEELPPESTSQTRPGKDVIEDTIASLDVEHNDRYKYNRKGQGETYCNLFVTDLAGQLGISLPSGDKGLDFDKDGKPDDYINANELVDWLRGDYNKGNVQTGPESGWSKVDATKAADLASEGYVVVAGWKNTDGPIGHVAIVRPESQPGKIMIAQAGESNFSNGRLQDGFGGLESKVEFFAFQPPN